MSRAAHVRSIDTLREFRNALLEFEHEVRSVLDELLLEQRRAEEWFTQDRIHYWPRQFRKASDWVQQARVDLERCELAIRPDERPSCLQQKKALERAKRRLRLSEEKVAAARQWSIHVRQATDDFRRKLTAMRDTLDLQLAAGVAELEQRAEALDRYVASTLPSPPSKPADKPQE